MFLAKNNVHEVKNLIKSSNIFKNDPQIIKNEYLYAERRNDMY